MFNEQKPKRRLSVMVPSRSIHSRFLLSQSPKTNDTFDGLALSQHKNSLFSLSTSVENKSNNGKLKSIYNIMIMN